MDFIAKEFSKDEIKGDYDYMISALFLEKIIAQEFHGVIYPSVRAMEKGMNVTILPEVVNNCMRLEGVIECIIQKSGNHIYFLDSRVAWVNAGEEKLNFITIEEDMRKRGITIPALLS